MDKLLCRLKRTQESPGPSGSLCRIKKPAVDENENAQSQTLSLETKNDLREVSLLLHDDDEVFPYLKESVRRNSASTAARSQTVDLFFAPAGEGFAGVSCGVQGAQGGAWLGGEPGADDSHRGQCCKGEPQGSGPRKQSGMGIPEDEPPRAFREGPGSELERACLHSVLGPLPHLCPEVSPSNETECVSPGHSEPVASEQTVEYKKMLPGAKSTSKYHLRITLRSLARQAFEVAKRLCHS